MDEARVEVLTGEVDHLGALGRVDAGTQADDPPVLHEDRAVLNGVTADGVDGGAHQRGDRLVLSGCGDGQEKGDEECQR